MMTKQQEIGHISVNNNTKNIAAYARFLGEELMGVRVIVRIVNTTNNFIACYGMARLDFNLRHLGYRWFEQGITEDVDQHTYQVSK